MNALGTSQRGIALMLVLWVLVLLTIIAVGLTATQRTETTLAGNQLAAARFRAAAEACVNWTILNLLAPPSVFEDELDAWVPDGAPRSWKFAGQDLEISLFNETSRIDLNTAPRELIAALLQAVELPQEQVDALADAIMDWRDADDLTGLNGAEDPDYEDAGLTYGAKDGPFDSVEELQQVLGVDRALYQTLAPALTVDSGGATLDQDFAQPLVLAALQGITLAEALLIEQQQESAEADEEAQLPAISRGGPLYRIRVRDSQEVGTGLSMESMVRLEPGRSPPVTVLWRRFGLLSESPL